MSARDLIPGVPAYGHYAGGFWHPGAVSTCSKCRNNGRFLKAQRERRLQQTVPPKQT